MTGGPCTGGGRGCGRGGAAPVGVRLRALLVALLLVVMPQGGLAADRVALVVGMAGYRTVVPLDNTANDARGLAQTLSGIGFGVTTLIDATGTELRDALAAFAVRAETAELALIYFAGHGVEVQGENFLIPVDAEVQSNRDIQRQAVSLREVLAAVDGARKMRVVILDSCRDDPFGGALDPVATAAAAAGASTRGTGQGAAPVRRGLAPAAPDRGTLVAYAARDGERALDGTGDNSPFAVALMRNLVRPGLEIGLMFRQVRDDVLQATANEQEPHTYGSLSGTPFYLAGASADDSMVADADRRVAWSDIRPDQEQLMAALAEQGDTRSMLGLAYIRLNAGDARYAPSEAVRLLVRAAERGSPEAQFELAQLYEAGVGVAVDQARALALYQAAAAQDFADALNDLGFLHFQGGLGLPRDPARAMALFERAASQRHTEAMYNFAALIDDGSVPGKGPEDAALYLYQALRGGNDQVLAILRDRPASFSAATRRALQARLAGNGFYAGALDGAFGPGTQRGLRAAFGLTD